MPTLTENMAAFAGEQVTRIVLLFRMSILNPVDVRSSEYVFSV